MAIDSTESNERELRVRIPDTMFESIDRAVDAGRYPDRKSYVRAALSAYTDSSFQAVGDRLNDLDELLIFQLYVNLITLLPQLNDADKQALRGMSDQLFLNGISGPHTILDNLDVARSDGSAVND